MKRLFVLVLLGVGFLSGQADTGEIHLRITDPSGAAMSAAVELSSVGNGYDKFFVSDGDGRALIQQIPFGVYRLQVRRAGFAVFSTTFPVSSSLLLDEAIQLRVAAQVTQIHVSATDTLINPDRPSAVIEIGENEIRQRLSSLPGRSVQDLVNSQPGWLCEGNAVLHPRGSEYQTQFVIDGIPLIDNRSPGFGPEIEADNLDSVRIYTAGFPAEFGRKLGGVVELNTNRQTVPGLHGQLVLSGGSFDTASSYGQLQNAWGTNNIGVSALGSMTSHYLNPVVPENFTNKGTTGDFSARFERGLSVDDDISFSARHEFSRFLIPNELVQEQSGQIQNGDNFETIGAVNFQHILSPNSLVAFASMARDNANDLFSNQKSTPIIAVQHNDFREFYFKGTFTHHQGRQELKAGAESDAIFLHENFSFTITDPAQFDPGTPASPDPFFESALDLEQSAFAQDSIRLGKWTASAGLRWDHYQLLLNKNALSPRISVGRFLPLLNMVVHGSFDRIFQTPSFENILITSSEWIKQVDPLILHLPVRPSIGSDYEAGFTEGFSDHLRLDVNSYRRDARNYADDDQLLDTGVTYPIAFNKSVIYGAEAKLDVLQLKQLSGYLSYSYMVGNAWFPVTGGLFLGQDANAALSRISGHLPDSQDQRNTLRTRFVYAFSPRIRLAAGAAYGSGLPFEYEGTPGEALTNYGPQMIARLNFSRGRVRPLLAVNSTVGLDIFKHEKRSLRFQIDGDNLNNRLNVIDFGGLFSGNAIGPARSVIGRLVTTF